MLILGLDLGTRTGWALGSPGAMPRSGSWTLKKTKQDQGVCMANLGCALRDLFREARPDLIEVERYLPPHAQLSHAASLGMRLNGALLAIAGVYGIPVEDAHNATVRKHFIGIGRLGDRTHTNEAVLTRAKALGYMPADSGDWDRANALAVWDHACALQGRVAARPFVLFNGRVSA